MIKTTRARLELRQEPDAKSALAAAAVTAVGAAEMAAAALHFLRAAAEGDKAGAALAAVRGALGGAFFAAGWLFLNGRSRAVLDLEHRMVLLCIGVGGGPAEGNRSYDLAEFSEAALAERPAEGLWRRRPRSLWSARLRRPDGSELELYWSRDREEAEAAARRAAEFAGLPFREG